MEAIDKERIISLKKQGFSNEEILELTGSTLQFIRDALEAACATMGTPSKTSSTTKDSDPSPIQTR